MMSMCVPANGFTVSFHSAVVPPPMEASLYPLPSALMVHLPNINLDFNRAFAPSSQTCLIVYSAPALLAKEYTPGLIMLVRTVAPEPSMTFGAAVPAQGDSNTNDATSIDTAATVPWRSSRPAPRMRHMRGEW
jgi:hypothetical protein